MSDDNSVLRVNNSRERNIQMEWNDLIISLILSSVKPPFVVP